MIACMAMHLLRGEMPLEPIVFMQTFGIMFLPSIPCIAAIALMFECVPFLSGRGGDVLYFFIWTLTLALPPALVSASRGHKWILAADFTGLGFFVKEIILVTGAHDFTIGVAPYNAALPPIFFPGLRLMSEILIMRLGSVLLAIPFFGIAWAAFKRFDPARRNSRVKTKTAKSAHLWQRVVSVWLRIIVPRGGWPVGPPSLVKAIALDVRLTPALYPIFFIVIALSLFFGLFASMSAIRTSVIPMMLFILVPLLASISTRDRINNTVGLVFGAPLVRRQFVAFKFFSSLFSALIVGFIPLVRLSLDNLFYSAAAVNGILFMVSAATLLGLLTGTPKTFVVMFLLFLYTAMSSEIVPAFDFAGLHAIATPSVVLVYAAASVMMVGTAFGFEKWRMMRGENL